MSDNASKERSHLDPTFKQVLADFLSSLSLDMQTEVEIGRLPRKIDALINIATKDKRERFHSQTPFIHFKNHNQIEFKGLNDRLTLWDYFRIQGRANFYIAEQKVSPPDMTVTIVSAGKPITVLNYNQPPHTFKSLGDGYYVNENCPQIYILVINELPIIPENYPLLIFASKQVTFRQALQQILANGAYSYINYAYKIRPQLTHEVLAMEGVTTVPRENLKFIAQDIGVDLLEFINPDEQLDRIPIEYQLNRINPEDWITGATPEKQRELLQLLLAQHLPDVSLAN